MTAKNGRWKHTPFCANYQPSASTVTDEQRVAIERILSSRDFVTLFRGGAGTGKTFALQEVEKRLRGAGFEVVVLAPQRQQVIDLQTDGFKAQTVAHFLTKKELPEKAVVILDEAGQIGGKQMAQLFETLKSGGARIILSGDTRQHGAVEASDALRAIEKHSGLKAAELRSIRRQDPELGKNENERSFIAGYRKAVRAASTGDILESFEQLDSMDCVKEQSEDSRKEVLAEDFLEAKQTGDRALIVTQTWDEIHAINDAVQRRLKEEGLLGETKKSVLFECRDLDNAQKQDPRYYQKDDFGYFTKGYGRFRKGELVKITSVDQNGISLRKDNKTSTVGIKHSNHFVVARKRELELSVGDRLQMKFNGRSLDDKAIVNGELVTIIRMFENGNIAVRDDRGLRKTLSPDQRLANLGYAVTSYASQGNTVDTILFSDSQCQAATNRNQWYVSISRARKKIRIYTSDKEALRENILRSGNSPMAIELAGRRIKNQSLVRKSLSRMEQIQKRVLQAAKRQMLATMQRSRKIRFSRRKIGIVA